MQLQLSLCQRNSPEWAKGSEIRTTAFRIAGIYAAASVAWILLSDRAVGLLTADPAVVARLQQWKGLFFVLATAGLIYWLIQRGIAALAISRERIAASERYFRSLWEKAPTAYESLDEEGRILDVNEAWLRLLGCEDRDEAVGHHISEFLEASQLVLLQERFPNFKATGHLENAEFVLQRRDDRLVTVIVDGRIQHDEQGRFERTHCVLHDITDRKAAERALRESEHRLALALDGARLGTFVWNHRDGTVRWSERQAQLYGTTLAEFGGTQQDVFDRIHPDDARRVRAALERARREDELIAVEYRAIWPDGSEHWLGTAGRFQYDVAGEPVSMGGVTMDIDSRKRAEAERNQLEEQLRQAQKMEAVGQLAGGVAHDFNNLLQVINGYAEMVLADLPADHSTRRFVEEVAGAGGRAAKLVGQLLAFSRRQVLEPEDVELNQVVGDLLEMAQRTLGEHIRVEWLPGSGLGTVTADRGQLEQVLMNLWINARDAMPDGGLLTIETGAVSFDAAYCRRHAWARPGRYVLLAITDSGQGMDPATVERIWEPFFTTKPPGKGTGLGLSTVYGIVRQHDGLIHLDSERGRGTSFRIYLPRVERPAGRVGEEVPPHTEGGDETILVAEDNLGVREFMRTALERAGYQVVTVTDGQAAVTYLEENGDDVDLALVDVVMPELGGREVHDQVRERHPDLRFLFTSGYSLDGVHTEFVLERGFELLQKPFEASTLLARVRRALGPS